MTLAFSAPGVGLLAVDTRYTNLTDGTGNNFGARIRRVAGGWVAGTGSSALILLALRKAAEEPDPSNLPEIVTGARNIVERYRGFPLKGDSMLLGVYESEGGFAIHGALASDGLRVSRGHSSSGRAHALIAWPVGIDTEHANRVNRGWQERLSSAKSMPDLLREVARAFEYGRTNGRNMSGEVEIGLTVTKGRALIPLQMREPTSWVIEATDAELVEVLSPPLPLPPFPLLPAEAHIFKPIEAA